MTKTCSVFMLAALLAACATPHEPVSTVGGLLQAQAAFTTSPDRCAVSMLFDNFRLELPAAQRTQSPERALTVSGGSGKRFKAQVRGAFVAPASVNGTVALDVAGQATTQRLGTQESFTLTFEGVVPASEQTRFRLIGGLDGTPSAGESALLVIDSLDLTFDPMPCAP